MDFSIERGKESPPSILSRIRSFWGSVTLLVYGLALMIHSLGVAVRGLVPR